MDKTHELYMDVQYGSLQKGPLETGCKQSSAPSGSMLKFLKSCVIINVSVSFALHTRMK